MPFWWFTFRFSVEPFAGPKSAREFERRIGRPPSSGHVFLNAKPTLSKFVTYRRLVSVFDAIGMPAPKLIVIFAEYIEAVAVVLLLVGIRTWFAVLSLILVMLVAIFYAGPDWKNIAVLVCCVAFLAGDVWSAGSFGLRRPALLR
nr:DoxX family protein [Natrinema gelatinilyticum]